MPYTEPPTFVTGTLLGASSLNILSDDVQYLQGHRAARSGAVPLCTAPDQTWKWRYMGVHRGTDLILVYVITDANADAVNFDYYDANNTGGVDLTPYIVGGGSFAVTVGTHTYTIDLSGLGTPPAVGQRYYILIESDPTSTGTFQLDRLYEDKDITSTYATPSTFADNTAPTAADLNELSTDVDYLETIRNPHNYPSVVCLQNDADWKDDGRRWRYQVVHQHDIVALEYTIGGAAHTTRPAIRYDGTDIESLIVGGGTFSGNIGTHAYTVDISSLSKTLGTVYAMRIEIDSATNSTWQLNYLYEQGSQATALPRQWTHGEVPTAAYMNAYSTNLEEVYDQWHPGRNHNMLVPFTNAGGATYTQWYYNAGAGQDIELTDYKFVRRYRWLHFFGEGSITDPSGVNDAITIDDNDVAGGAAYDLDESGWIILGTAYTVTGVSVALESELGE